MTGPPQAASTGGGPEQSASSDLDQILQSNPFRGLLLPELIRRVYQDHGPIQPAAELDVEALKDAIHSASDLLAEAGELIARGKDGKQELVAAILIVSVWIAQQMQPSSTLKTFIAELVRKIVELPMFGGSIGWTSQDIEEFYRHAQWAERQKHLGHS